MIALYTLDKDILNPNLAISAKPFPKSLTAGMFCNEFGLYAITCQTRYCNSFAGSLLLYPMKIRHSSIKMKIKNIAGMVGFEPTRTAFASLSTN